MAKKTIVVIAGILAIFCFFESRTFGKIAQNDGETCFHKIPCQWEKLDDYFPLPKDFPKEDFPKENPNAKSRFVLIDLQQQAFGAYENGKLAFWGPISSGRRKFETPEGNFKILQKAIQNRMEELQCRTPLNFTATIGFMPDRFRESRILTVASDLWKKTPENFSNGS